LLACARESTVRDRSLSDTESDLEKHPGFTGIVAAARKRHAGASSAGQEPPREPG
jgi:hypothetical protein